MSIPALEQHYMATCPKGLEAILAKELQSLGVQQVQESIAAVYFSAPQSLAYYVISWSRIANRVVLVLARERCDNLAAFDQMLSGCDWQTHFSSEQSLLVDFNGTNNEIRNIRYGAQRTKDQIQAYFQAKGDSTRLTISADEPEVKIYVRAFKNRYTVGFDLIGDSLHRRAYRAITGAAPLKENLAAAILRLLGWTSYTDDQNVYTCLYDPMCGSATLLIEAALIALNIAPSYLRSDDAWLLTALKSYDQTLWNNVRAPIQQQRQALEAGELSISQVIFGSDIDPRSIAAARENIESARLERYIEVKQSALSDTNPYITKKIKALHGASPQAEDLPPQPFKGLTVSNPPYGQRLGETTQLVSLYQQIGELWRESLTGFDAALLTGNHELGFKTKYRSWRQHKLFNGLIECQLQRYRIDAKSQRSEKFEIQDQQAKTKGLIEKDSLDNDSLMLYNRLKKFQRRYKNELKQLNDAPYRCYDADLPEFNVLIDVYPCREGVYIQLQEYAPPESVDKKQSERRLFKAHQAVAACFDIPLEKIVIKQRERKKGKQQYQKQTPSTYTRADLQKSHHCMELGYQLAIDPLSYLDTGVFIDSRGVRRWIQTQAKQKNFLNLFAYTGLATVAAAKAGAKSSVSVDLSATYTAWAKQNFELNQLDLRSHHLQQADCLRWLEDDTRSFDLILLDPPSFSNSKRMDATLDIQRDHSQLIDLAVSKLSEKGQLLFVTNKRGFKIDAALDNRYSIQELTQVTRDFDCQQSRQVHRSWLITRIENT